jgi:hypothetical protein
MNRNAVFAALKNFERANTDLKNINKRLNAAGEKIHRANVVYERMQNAHHPRTRQNTAAEHMAHKRFQNAHQEYRNILNAYTNAQRRITNAYQRLAHSVNPLIPFPPGWTGFIHAINRNQARHVVRNIRALQNVGTMRRVARLGTAWRNTVHRRHQVRSAHVSLTRSGLPKEIASRITRHALRN